MADAAGPEVPVAENPALVLGAVIGAGALQGRDKLTFVVSPGLEAFPVWLEQLVAESTGKDGKGIVPVAGEGLGDRRTSTVTTGCSSTFRLGDDDADGQVSMLRVGRAPGCEDPSR